MSLKSPYTLKTERGSYSAIVYKDGDLYVAEDNVGTQLKENSAATTVIQAAIDTLGNSDSLFLRDDFVINSQINVDCEIGIFGTNKNLLSTNQDIAVFKITADNVSFKDITVENTHAAPTEKAIYAMGTTGDHLENITMDNCHVKGAHTGIYLIYCDHNTIFNCRINDTKNRGIFVESCIDSTIMGCHVTTPGTGGWSMGIASLKSDFSKIEANHIIDMGVTRAVSGIIVCCGDRNTVIGNTVEGGVQGITHGSYYADLEYLNIIGNHVHSSEESGIWYCGSVLGFNQWVSRVGQNTVTNCGGSGILVGAPNNECNIAYSLINGNVSWYNTRYGLEFQKHNGTIAYIHVVDEDYQGNVMGAISGVTDVTGLDIRRVEGWNPLGVSVIGVGASPFTYQTVNSPETVYISGGTVSLIKKSGVTLFTDTGHSVALDPLETVEVTYSVLPTMVRDVQ